MAKSRHRDLRTLLRYVRPGIEAVARLTAEHDRARRTRSCGYQDAALREKNPNHEFKHQNISLYALPQRSRMPRLEFSVTNIANDRHLVEFLERFRHLPFFQIHAFAFVAPGLQIVRI